MHCLRWIVVPGLCVLLCGAEASGKAKNKGKETKPAPAEVVVEGKILIVRGLHGGEPQLTAQDGQRWLLSGSLREELLRFEGHRLKVWATSGEKKLMMPTLAVNRYDVLDSGGGRRPVVGALRRGIGQSLVLERKEGLLEVAGSPPLREQMEKYLGCKVWVVGDLDGKRIKAFKFGWINCKTDKSLKPGKETEK
jgi:hypothetical protein